MIYSLLTIFPGEYIMIMRTEQTAGRFVLRYDDDPMSLATKEAFD